MYCYAIIASTICITWPMKIKQNFVAGLWITDITITQIYQEAIQENKRGMVGGVQESLNMLLDVLKSILVILFPFPSQFGLLILLSVAFVIMGYLCLMRTALIRYLTKNTKVLNQNSDLLFQFLVIFHSLHPRLLLRYRQRRKRDRELKP
jgi:hypothetical protein